MARSTSESLSCCFRGGRVPTYSCWLQYPPRSAITKERVSYQPTSGVRSSAAWDTHRHLSITGIPYRYGMYWGTKSPIPTGWCIGAGSVWCPIEFLITPSALLGIYWTRFHGLSQVKRRRPVLTLFIFSFSLVLSLTSCTPPHLCQLCQVFSALEPSDQLVDRGTIHTYAGTMSPKRSKKKYDGASSCAGRVGSIRWLMIFFC